VIPDAAPERLALPALAPPPPRPPFPFVATAAPVLVSIGIWAVTGSVYSLLFAALGPVVAVGGLLDGRRQRRRAAARDAARAVAALVKTRDRVLDLHERERARLERAAPSLPELCLPEAAAARWAHAGSGVAAGDVAPIPVRLGRARRPSMVILDDGAAAREPDEELPAAVRAALDELRSAASGLNDAPWLVDARDGVGIVGALPAARALARSVALQVAANCSPATARISAALDPGCDERWLSDLPHAVSVTSAEAERGTYRFRVEGADPVVAFAAHRSQLPSGLGSVVELAPRGAEEARAHAARFELVGSARARDAASALAVVAAEHGLLASHRALPHAVTLSEVLNAAPGADRETARTGLRAPVGLDASGVAELDLVRDGPHAVVAGTTGAGKSELLVSWVLAMAARHPPRAVTFLLVDFKGGAAFAPLAGLPHVIGTVSDLDPRRSARAIESLRAELLRRERALFEAGARSIDDLESRAVADSVPLARLVIVVDEFAAVVSGQPELHELFADISARGRSLGLHLILCTQRPSGVVRDAVLANVTLRISLRVTDRGDSTAMLGTDAATRLSPTARGRALIADGSGQLREVQLALAEPGDASRVRAAEQAPSAAMWCDPLPDRLPLGPLLREAAVEAATEAAEGAATRGAAAGAVGSGAGIPFGRLDLPTEQCQPIARLDPRSDGHLLVLGAARSGRTTVLRTIAAAAAEAGVGCAVVPDDPAEASSLLGELLDHPDDRIGFVLVDDLDLLLARTDPDLRHELTDLLTRFVRGARQVSLVITAQSLTGGLHGFAGLFDARVLLRQSSRDEHVLGGGDGASFDPSLPAGAGRWTGRRGGGAIIQVAIGPDPLPAARLVELPALRPGSDRPLAIVCPRPAHLAMQLSGTGARVVVLGDAPAPDEGELRISRGEPATVLLGDPDAWQAEWALLGFARRELPIVVIGCSPSELRAIARVRDAPPPLGARRGECWWIEEGTVRRAVLDLQGD